MNKKQNKQIQDLGYANEWHRQPEGYVLEPGIVRMCEFHNHELKAEEITNDIIKYTCEICRYSYKQKKEGKK
ncbi:MAG: hypothetical protein J6Z08_00610 [Elusimicrobiales bacterium]|nr:hypothetical protein [Elusimicrobiales bacterium]